MKIVKALVVMAAAAGFAVSASCGSASAPAEVPPIQDVVIPSGK